MKDIKIILIEDNPGHATLIKKNLRRAGIRNDIKILSNGETALSYFFENDYSEDFFDNMLVILDLNLPGISGLEVLKKLKSNSLTQKVLTIVLTTSDDSNEIKECYKFGCNAYITKPVDYNKFSDAINKIGLFIKVVKLPKEEL